MITETDITNFESFLKSQGVHQGLVDKLIATARRENGLPTPKSLRSSLDCIGSGVFDTWTLGYILERYALQFPATLYRAPKKRQKIFLNPWQGRL